MAGAPRQATMFGAPQYSFSAASLSRIAARRLNVNGPNEPPAVRLTTFSPAAMHHPRVLRSRTPGQWPPTGSAIRGLLAAFGSQFNESPDCFGTGRRVGSGAAPAVHHSQELLKNPHLKRRSWVRFGRPALARFVITRRNPASRHQSKVLAALFQGPKRSRAWADDCAVVRLHSRPQTPGRHVG
jgi:hypothetical protein